MQDKDNKKLSAEELAAKLEEKAQRLREAGLSPEQLEKVAGGGWCGSDGSCCGTVCRVASTFGDPCTDATTKEGHIPGDGSGECWHACIKTSPD